jgi:hypothetical protein
MKLIDFNKTLEFQNLRNKMSAQLIDFSGINWQRLNSDSILERLNSYEGIDVTLKEIEICGDGTFEYNGTKVLLYIRDQYSDMAEYKFHLCTCKTIFEMKNRNRLERFVISTRTDGKFKVNIVNKITNAVLEKGVIKDLKVCKNCLLALNYKRYSSHQTGRGIYNSFSLEEYFRIYKGSNHNVLPNNDTETAPINQYTPDWDIVSTSYRSSKNWICEDCGIQHKQNKNLLHVHHLNSIRSDNSYMNLVAVCKECHSKYPGHKHLHKKNVS